MPRLREEDGRGVEISGTSSGTRGVLSRMSRGYDGHFGGEGVGGARFAASFSAKLCFPQQNPLQKNTLMPPLLCSFLHVAHGALHWSRAELSSTGRQSGFTPSHPDALWIHCHLDYLSTRQKAQSYLLRRYVDP